MATSGVSLPGAEAIAPDARGESRRHLLALRAAGETYRFLDAGWRYLAVVADDAPIALEVLRGLVTIGLGGPAQELLDALPELGRIAGDELPGKLRLLPSGRIAWDALRPAWSANMAALRRHQPHLRLDEAMLRGSLEAFDLYRSADGRLHLARRNQGGLRTWIPALGARAPDSAAPREPRQPVLVVGLLLDDFVERLRAATARPAGEPQGAICLAEPELPRLAAWLHAADRGGDLADPRVLLFAGPHAAADLEGHLAADSYLDVPRLRLGCHAAPPVCTEFDQACRRAAQAREHALHALSTSIGRRAAAPLRPGASVLGFASRFTTVLQHSIRDIGRALDALGYRFTLAIEPADHCGSSALTVGRAIEAAEPDLILLINHFRHEMPVPAGATPILTWIQDPTDVVLDRRTAERLGPLDFQAGFYRQRCVGELGYPAERFHSVPFIPVCDVTFHDGPIPPEERERYACDVAYLGHYRGTPEEHAQLLRRQCPEALHPAIDAIERRVAEVAASGAHLHLRDAAPIVDEALAACGSGGGGRADERVRSNLANFLAYRLFDVRFRLETLVWVAEWADRTRRRFRVYGTGWERHPRLSRYAAGPAAHGEEARRACRGAAVTIQTIPSGLPHQRTFEALLSGSLVLARWCPDDFDGLRPAAFRAARGDGAGTDLLLYRHGFRGLDRIVFDGPAALEDRLEQALGDAPWRDSVVAGMRAAVARHFTCAAVVPAVMDFLRQRLTHA
jgi:hypothetical protein